MKNKGKHPSDLQTITLVIPGMMLIGIYLVMNGHISPGGGFQGGAVLAAVIVSHFLINPDKEIDTDKLKSFEKKIFIALALCGIIYIVTGLHWDFPDFYEFYIFFMNALLGIKVFCGLSIIFIEFAIEFK
jgi:multicomponent Na+:H+ antiporter subunit B